jgi:hypothetical protein
MGIWVGPPPVERTPTREEQQDAHAFREARREVDSWFTGPLYEWRPFTEEDGPVRPLEAWWKQMTDGVRRAYSGGFVDA